MSVSNSDGQKIAIALQNIADELRTHNETLNKIYELAVRANHEDSFYTDHAKNKDTQNG